MGSAFHQLCPRYRGTLTPTVPTAIRLGDTFTFLNIFICISLSPQIVKSVIIILIFILSDPKFHKDLKKKTNIFF